MITDLNLMNELIDLIKTSDEVRKIRNIQDLEMEDLSTRTLIFIDMQMATKGFCSFKSREGKIVVCYA